MDKYWESMDATAGEAAVQVGIHDNWCKFAKVERGELSWGLANAAHLGCTCGALDRKERAKKMRDKKRRQKGRRREEKEQEEEGLRGLLGV